MARGTALAGTVNRSALSTFGRGLRRSGARNVRSHHGCSVGLWLGRSCGVRRACRGNPGVSIAPPAPVHCRLHVARRGRAAFGRLVQGRVRSADPGGRGDPRQADIAGAATFSIANAVLVTAKDRKRCGECKPQPSEAEAPGSGTSIALGTALDAVPGALVLGVTLRAGGPDLALVVALALANVPEALSGTAGMRLASRSSTYVLGLWSGTTLGTAATTALAFYLLSDLGPHATAILKAYGAGALIAMTAETMIPEAFHHGPRYSGVLAATGFAALILISELAK